MEMQNDDHIMATWPEHLFEHFFVVVGAGGLGGGCAGRAGQGRTAGKATCLLHSGWHAAAALQAGGIDGGMVTGSRRCRQP